MGGVRLDLQLSPQTRLMARANTGDDERPIDNPPAGAHPSAAGLFERHMDEIYTSLTQVFGSRALNEIKASKVPGLREALLRVLFKGVPNSDGIGGGIPHETEVASQYIAKQIEIDRSASAAAVSVALLLISFAVLFVLRRLSR